MDHHIYTQDMVKLKMTMRKLWTDHTIWTRQFIVDLLGNLPSIDKTVDRLLKNQEQIGNCFREFFGDIAGDNLTSLLKEHITIAADLLRATMNGDTIKATTSEEQWVTNAENISTLLSMVNPCYPVEELKDLFNTYLILVKYQFIARMNGDYNGDIMYYDMGLHHILTISDFLTRGIIETFFEEQMMDTYQDYTMDLYQSQTEEHTQIATNQPQEQTNGYQEEFQKYQEQ